MLYPDWDNIKVIHGFTKSGTSSSQLYSDEYICNDNGYLVLCAIAHNCYCTIRVNNRTVVWAEHFDQDWENALGEDWSFLPVKKGDKTKIIITDFMVRGSGHTALGAGYIYYLPLKR